MIKIILAALFVVTVLSPPAGAETIRIAGSGGMILLMNDLAQAYMKKNPGETVEVDQKSLGTVGGVLAVRDGVIDIGMTAKRLSRQLKSLKLNEFEIARVPVEFGINGNVALKGLSDRQICDLYAGKIGNWRLLGGADAPVVLLSRPDSDSTYLAVAEGLSCFAAMKPNDRVRVLLKSNEMAEELARTSNAIGMVDSVTILKSGGKIRPLALNGQKATREAVAKGSWPMVKEFTLVLGKRKTPAIRRFLQFIRSPQGKAIITRNDALPSAFRIDF